MTILQTEKAHAKLNLFLHLTGKREDGYHLLKSLVTFLDLHDVVQLKPKQQEDPTCILSGPFAKDLKHLHDMDNLALRAAKIFAGLVGKELDIDLHIDKNIPPGGGLGGGSVNAASTIKALIDYWDITIDPDELQTVLVSLGADVPVCYAQKNTYIENIGDQMVEGPDISNIPLVLISPLKPCDTARVYKNVEGRFPADTLTTYPDIQSSAELVSFLKETRNDLTAAATQIVPEIASVLSALDAQDGCEVARMSGSGSVCFGVFETQGQAQAATSALKNAHPDWWVYETKTI